MKCLSCQMEMVNYLVKTRDGEIAYDVCEKCGGVWLDKGELNRMAFEVDGDIEYCTRKPAEDTGEQPKQCPRCEGKVLDMVKFLDYGDIVLEKCSNCHGFWLDGKELDLINEDLERIMPILSKGFSEFMGKAHIPYWYERVKRKSNETDFMLEVPPIKGGERLAETDYDCPACDMKLSKYSIFGIEFEGCEKCKGVFLDKDELRKLKDKSTKGSWRTLRWMDDETEAIEASTIVLSDRRCPKCTEERLATTNFGGSGVLIDICPACGGTWLDQGEYRKIEGLLKQNLINLSSKDMVKKLWSEVKEIWTGPEGTISETMDAIAAAHAFLNITIFDHPKLANAVMEISKKAKETGLG